MQAIQLGATYALAAQYGGVTYETFNNWMNKGEAARSGVYFQFFNAIKEAEGKGAIGWLAKIEKAANDGSWQAAAWKLERRYPEQYGRQVKDNRHSGYVGTFNPAEMSTEQLTRLANGEPLEKVLND